MKEFLSEQFRLSGRMPRWPFFWRQLVWSLAFMVGLSMVALMLSGREFADTSGIVLAIAFVIGGAMVIGLLVASTSLYVRRLHDLDLSGWWYLALLIVSFILGGVQDTMSSVGLTIGLYIISSLPYLYLLFKRGTDGPNRFDDQPYELQFGRAAQ